MLYLTLLTFLVATTAVKSETINVGIIHFNDIYGQLEHFKSGSNPPEPCVVSENNCVGGIAEIMGHIKAIQVEEFPDMELDSNLVISTGNLISGDNGWMSILDEELYDKNAWSTYGKLMAKNWPNMFADENYYRPNFTTLGMREFDGGLTRLNSYLKKADIRPVISNLDCDEPQFVNEKEFCRMIDNFQILSLGNNFKIGVVGYVNTLVVHHSEPGKLKFMDTTASLSKIINEELRDVNAVVAIGTGSLSFAKSIVDSVPKVKLVIYGAATDTGMPESYPLKYKESHIVTAGKFGSTIGKLFLQIDTSTGNIIALPNSALVEIDASEKPDNYAQSDIVSYSRSVTSASKDIALTKVQLDGKKSSCWTNECSLGNLITDAMVHCAFKKNPNSPAELISIWHSGGFSGELQKDSNINVMDVKKWLPYHNNVTVVSVNGTTLTKIFEISAAALNSTLNPNWGQFLQVSNGVEVHYTSTDGVGALASLKVAQLEDDRLKMRNIEDWKQYHIVIPSFFYNGRNVYHFLPGTFITGGGLVDKVEIGPDHKCVENYIKDLSVLRFGVQKRIYINE